MLFVPSQRLNGVAFGAKSALGLAGMPGLGKV
jgi:hypothetical protein